MNMRIHTHFHIANIHSILQGAPRKYIRDGGCWDAFQEPKRLQTRTIMLFPQKIRKNVRNPPQKKRLIFVAILATKRTILGQFLWKKVVQFKRCFPKFLVIFFKRKKDTDSSY